MNQNTNCPCGSNKFYSGCCKKAHDNIKMVETAEALMRSRYAAFTMANGDYLKLSQHSTTQPKSKAELDGIEQWAKSVHWIKLEVLNSTNGSANDSDGSVEFKAFYTEQGLPACIHEKSRFVKENGYWVYLDGVSF